MKILLSFAFLFLISLSFGQNKLDGKYLNQFGDSIVLKDSIYNHYVKIEKYSNHYVGIFKKTKDTLFFDPSFDFTTLRRNNSAFKNRIVKDSFIDLWTKQEKYLTKNYIWRFKTPTKMVFRVNKLYLIKANGELDLREFIADGEKHRNYFIKIE